MEVNKTFFCFFNFYPQNNEVGITQKIKNQIRTVRSFGYNVHYCGYITNGVAIFNNEDKIEYVKKYSFLPPKIFNYIKRFLLILFVIDHIDNKRKYDYAYLRWVGFDYFFLKMLKCLKGCGSINIVELHAWSSTIHITNIKMLYTVLSDKINLKQAIKYIDEFATISNDCNIKNANIVKIENGINTDNIKPRKWKYIEGKLRLCAVAIERDYHGYDRLIKGLYIYYNEFNVQVDVTISFVGIYSLETQKLVKKLNLENKVKFLGPKTGEELNKIYANSDLGIGALAHNRVGMYSGSSLKTKEYCANGLPFVYGWQEMSFDDNYPYALHYVMDESPININCLIFFFNGIKNDKNMIGNMQKYAIKNFSWKEEFKKILMGIGVEICESTNSK